MADSLEIEILFRLPEWGIHPDIEILHHLLVLASGFQRWQPAVDMSLKASESPLVLPSDKQVHLSSLDICAH